jgi:hypothetical protein
MEVPMETTKEKIRPYYEELKSLLDTLPLPDEFNKNRLGDFEPVSHLNVVVSLVSAIADENLDRFRFPYEPQSSSIAPIPDSLSVLRGKINTLVGYLYGQFYKDEQAPFSGYPQTINTLTAMQEQTVKVDFRIELQTFLDQRLKDKEFQNDCPERNFIQKLKDVISKAKDAAEVMSAVFTLANKIGLTTATLASIFS